MPTGFLLSGILSKRPLDVAAGLPESSFHLTEITGMVQFTYRQ